MHIAILFIAAYFYVASYSYFKKNYRRNISTRLILKTGNVQIGSSLFNKVTQVIQTHNFLKNNQTKRLDNIVEHFLHFITYLLSIAANLVQPTVNQILRVQNKGKYLHKYT